MERMRILLVGGAGEIGKYLVKNYAHQGHAVAVLDKARPPDIPGGSEVTYLQGNITDKGLVDYAVGNSDVVIHLAWSFADDPQTIFNEDLKGHINLLEAASSSKVKSFIYSSTATVYGRAAIHPVSESHPCLIGNARKPLYALGKYVAEELCKLYYTKHGLPITIFRFWWAFGDSIAGSHLRDLVRKALNHQSLEMVQGAGGTFVTMSDLARAIMLAIDQPAAAGRIYNLGSLFLTWEEIGETIKNLTNSDSHTELGPAGEWQGPAFLNEVWDLDWSKAERELLYSPGGSVEEIKSQFTRALQACVTLVESERK
jgi:nucleoside-diphosphate-sugar epimerase